MKRTFSVERGAIALGIFATLGLIYLAGWGLTFVHMQPFNGFGGIANILANSYYVLAVLIILGGTIFLLVCLY